MRFHYTASQPNGKIIEGDMEAKTSAEILVYLSKQGLKPVSLKAIRDFEEVKKGGIFGQLITVTDKVFLTKYLALMLKVGTDLLKAVDILISDFDKPAMKTLLIEIRSNLEKGLPFFTTFAKYPKYFSPVFVNLIKAGEASGNLEKIFWDLSFSLEREQELRNKVRSTMTYPVILLVASALILILLVSFALPKIANIFLSSGINPPLFSAIVFSIGLFVGKYLWFILGFLLISGFALWYLFSKTLVGRKIIFKFVLRIPVIKDVFKQMAIQRFASTLSSLLSAGLPILDSLEITAGAVGSENMKESLMRISREGVAKGLTIGEAFGREPIFPKMIANLISISEKAGHFETILKTIADFYESEIESSIKSLVSFLEPVLLLIIGVIIGTIALAIIVPIYQLVGQF